MDLRAPECHRHRPSAHFHQTWLADTMLNMCLSSSRSPGKRVAVACAVAFEAASCHEQLAHVCCQPLNRCPAGILCVETFLHWLMRGAGPGLFYWHIVRRERIGLAFLRLLQTLMKLLGLDEMAPSALGASLLFPSLYATAPQRSRVNVSTGC